MTDQEIREKLLSIWKKLGPSAMKAHCGGKGLTVGCPVCKKRWAK
jgi:hypothetical protein